DVIGAEPPQALVPGTPDVAGGEAPVVRPVPHLAVHLGGEDDALPPAAALHQPAADDLLGHALARLPAVDVRGVEEVDPRVERAVHDREAVGLGRLRAEVHGAEAETAHAETGAAEADILHARGPSTRPGGLH